MSFEMVNRTLNALRDLPREVSDRHKLVLLLHAHRSSDDGVTYMLPVVVAGRLGIPFEEADKITSDLSRLGILQPQEGGGGVRWRIVLPSTVELKR